MSGGSDRMQTDIDDAIGELEELEGFVGSFVFGIPMIAEDGTLAVGASLGDILPEA